MQKSLLPRETLKSLSLDNYEGCQLLSASNLQSQVAKETKTAPENYDHVDLSHSKLHSSKHDLKKTYSPPYVRKAQIPLHTPSRSSSFTYLERPVCKTFVDDNCLENQILKKSNLYMFPPNFLDDEKDSTDAGAFLNSDDVLNDVDIDLHLLDLTLQSLNSEHTDYNAFESRSSLTSDVNCKRSFTIEANSDSFRSKPLGLNWSSIGNFDENDQKSNLLSQTCTPTSSPPTQSICNYQNFQFSFSESDINRGDSRSLVQNHMHDQCQRFRPSEDVISPVSSSNFNSNSLKFNPLDAECLQLTNRSHAHVFDNSSPHKIVKQILSKTPQNLKKCTIKPRPVMTSTNAPKNINNAHQVSAVASASATLQLTSMPSADVSNWTGTSTVTYSGNARSRPTFSSFQKITLNDWVKTHSNNCYPSKIEKQQLSQETALTF
eukprot:Awhi_evm1s9716